MSDKNNFFVPPSNTVTADMIQRAKVEDPFHFAGNLNSMMAHGYCTNCGMAPAGCDREGCGKTAHYR